jgi:hypothetical protein
MVRTIWPDAEPYQTGDDFVDAVQRALPLDLLGTPSGRYDPPPLRIAHVYDPDRVNGFPPTPVGEWLINGGWIGVLVGGLISGVALRSLQRRYRDFESNTLSWTVMFVFVGTIMPLGIIVASVFRYKLMALPMLVIMLILRTAPVRSALERGHTD